MGILVRLDNRLIVELQKTLDILGENWGITKKQVLDAVLPLYIVTCLIGLAEVIIVNVWVGILVSLITALVMAIIIRSSKWSLLGALGVAMVRENMQFYRMFGLCWLPLLLFIVWTSDQAMIWDIGDLRIPIELLILYISCCGDFPPRKKKEQTRTKLALEGF